VPKIDPPPSSEKANRKSKEKGSKPGWVKHTSPDGLRRGLNRLMNRILQCDDPLSHAGQYASLANAMTNSQKMSNELDKYAKLLEEVEALKEKMEKE
jgi:hypothetical protein